MAIFKFSWLDFLLTFCGLIFLVFDIALDIWAVVTFYQEKDYVSFSILVLLLLVSSVLVQAFSLLWYSYENFQMETKVEKCLSVGKVKLLHVLQLGIYLRHAGVIFSLYKDLDKDLVVYLSHDLSMLRLVETFSESAPQLVFMLTIILRRGQFDPVTVLKALGSASAIALTVTMYHRSLRSFLPDKKTQKIISSLVYYLWNLFLLLSRLVALALFASVLPCFIFSHFLCSWLILFFFVWRSKTDFMDSPCGEWLYRATVGLIWYFNWFNVVEGKTLRRTLLYHLFILADIFLLCTLWCWKFRSMEQPFHLSDEHAIIAASCVFLAYILGLCLKMIYYRWLHPNVAKEELKENEDRSQLKVGLGPTRKSGFTEEAKSKVLRQLDEDLTDGPCLKELDFTVDMNRTGYSEPPVKRCNKRMRKLAENFYS